MSNRRNIEELRDMLKCLGHDAQFLYRYGNPGNSISLFNSLSLNDQKRLICLALTKGDGNIQNVARYFMQKLTPMPQSFEDLLAQLPPEDKEEIVGINKNKVLEPKSLAITDRQRIVEELQKACEQIGSLEVEEAFWILIPDNPEEETVWIKAMGQEKEGLPEFRFPFSVTYNPEKEEKYKLITTMRSARWILHIHNHPVLRGEMKPYISSTEDRGFAKQWQMYRPELAGKMMFFVVCGDRITHYSGRMDLDLT